MVIDKIKKRGNKNIRQPENKGDIPVGKWMKCDKCGEILYREDVRKNYSVCMSCGHHFRLSSRRRIWQTLDENSFQAFDLNLKTVNPLEMQDYAEKLRHLQTVLEIDDAVVCGTGKINKEPVVICVMDGNFLMGSMGSVVGEKITYSIEKAIELKLPLIIFSVSGGARMQEGIISLMQMAKTSSAIAKLNEAGRIIYFSLDGSNLWWCDSKFCLFGRYCSGRAKCNDWFCWKKSDQTDDWRRFARRFPDSRILARAWFCRQNCREKRYEGNAL